MAKIAVVGSGISGLTCAYLLRNQHDVTLFEANDYPGGHTHTHEIEVEGKSVHVDTGFIVYNDRTYPNFIKLLNELGVEGVPTEMSFSVKDQAANLEYNGHNLNTLFAQRINIFRPGFYQLIRDILRFNRMAKEITEANELSLADWLSANKFSNVFREKYIYPMAAAIWSTGDQTIGEFPIRALADFFINHGLVDLKNRPQWYVVKGGSNQYIKAMMPSLGDVQINARVRSISRYDDHVVLKVNEEAHRFDEVIIAAHSDEALAMLEEPTPQEREILGNITYTPNTAYLHTDKRQLPRRRLAWASWNYNVDNNKSDQATLTYNMNILQHIQTETQVLVTLNAGDQIDPTRIIDQFEYAHPFYDQNTLLAQQRHHEISAQNRTHYCGAYWSYGFHEDGVKSALRVCSALGVNW